MAGKPKHAQQLSNHLNAPIDGLRPDPSFGNIVEVVPDARSINDMLSTNFGIQLSTPSPALAAFTTTEPESAHERRERLRDERRTLVAALARRTGEPHAAINARLNRQVGAASVVASTVDQLERANDALRKLV